MQSAEEPSARRLVTASRILVWITAALLAALGALFTIEGISGPGETARELYLVPGAIGLLMAAVLATGFRRGLRDSAGRRLVVWAGRWVGRTGVFRGSS
jgi:hypothetical protein